MSSACTASAVHRFEGFSPRGGNLCGSLDFALFLCDEHRADHQALMPGGLASFPVSTLVDTSRQCGDAVDLRTRAAADKQASG